MKTHFMSSWTSTRTAATARVSGNRKCRCATSTGTAASMGRAAHLNACSAGKHTNRQVPAKSDPVECRCPPTRRSSACCLARSPYLVMKRRSASSVLRYCHQRLCSGQRSVAGRGWLSQEYCVLLRRTSRLLDAIRRIKTRPLSELHRRSVSGRRGRHVRRRVTASCNACADGLVAFRQRTHLPWRGLDMGRLGGLGFERLLGSLLWRAWKAVVAGLAADDALMLRNVGAATEYPSDTGFGAFGALDGPARAHALGPVEGHFRAMDFTRVGPRAYSGAIRDCVAGQRSAVGRDCGGLRAGACTRLERGGSWRLGTHCVWSARFVRVTHWIPVRGWLLAVREPVCRDCSRFEGATVASRVCELTC